MKTKVTTPPLKIFVVAHSLQVLIEYITVICAYFLRVGTNNTSYKNKLCLKFNLKGTNLHICLSQLSYLIIKY